MTYQGIVGARFRDIDIFLKSIEVRTTSLNLDFLYSKYTQRTSYFNSLR